MPLKKAQGNMYDWVTDIHSHLAGECPHKCSYCYVQRNRFGVSPRYKGEPKLIEFELNENYYKYGENRIIFIEHMNDLFAEGIKYSWITGILNHCKKYPNNTYVIQTKNPGVAMHWYELGYFPKDFILGSTIETNRLLQDNNISKAPDPYFRYMAMLKFPDIKKFITIEPIMDFDVDILSKWIIEIKPDFINIGADSKWCKLPEPSKEKILDFVDILNKNNIVIKKKMNLSRLLR